MDYLLGIDVGTTNWKAAVFDEDGNLESISRTNVKTHHDQRRQAYYLSLIHI